MATRLKTVEYCFPKLDSLANNTLTTFSLGNALVLPENSKTFRSAVVEITWDDIITGTGGTLTTKRIDFRLGAAAYTTISNTQTLTHSGENMSMFLAQDFVSHFTTNWSGTSMTCNLQIQLNQSTGTTQGFRNVCAKLILTYSFDDATTTDHVKTVRIPLDAPVGALATSKPGTAVAVIPALDTYLPEAGITIRDCFIQWKGNTLNIGGATTTDHEVTLQLDASGASETAFYEAQLASDRFTNYIWRLMGASAPLFTTNATHNFFIWTSSGAVARHHHSQIWLVVTYTFNPVFTTRMLNSVLLPSDIPGFWGGTTIADYQRVTRRLWIEEPGTITKTNSAAYLFWHQPANITQIYARVNSGSWVNWTGIGDVLCGSMGAMLRCEDDITLARGTNSWNFDIYNTNANVRGANSSILWMINYYSDVPSDGSSNPLPWAANHTVIRNLLPIGTAGASIIRLTTTVSPNIPETNFFINGLGLEYKFMTSGTGNPAGSSIDFELLSAEGGMAWKNVQSDISRDDPETGVRHVFAQLRDDFFRWNGDVDTSRVNIETDRRWRATLANGASSFDYLDLYITYHSITGDVSGNVSGSNGGTVTIDLHRSSDGAKVKSTTRTGNGAYTFKWYDNTQDVYTVARETDSFIGRSPNGKITLPTAYEAPAPSAPTATAASSVGTTSFTANWNSVSGATSYRLDVSTTETFNIGTFVSGYDNKTVSGTSDNVTDLTADTTYYYRVRAVNSSGTSANSNTITQKTNEAVSIPATPTGLNVYERSGNRWGASWNSSSGATGYKVRYRVNSGSWFTVDVGNVLLYEPFFTYDDCDFIEVEVLAYNSAGDSSWSLTSNVYINCM
jgi:hypothetical protein